MIDRLTADDVQDFVHAHEFDDEKELILKNKYLFDLPSSVIADQIVARRKIRKKLPSYYQTRGVVYPPSVHLEQSSSEETAIFKADILAEFGIKKLADLTGGFGIDTLYFAKRFVQAIYAEVDSALIEFAKHNHHIFQQENITYLKCSAEEFLKQNKEPLDCVYLDPSRRDDAQRKVFRFSDCSPDVVALEKSLLSQARLLLVKASPLVDIHYTLQEFRHVRKVYIIAVDDECKEVLLLCDRDFHGEPTIHTEDLTRGHQFIFKASQEKDSTSTFSNPLKYIYEPGPSIMKAGAFKLIGNNYALAKLHTSTHFYTSEALVGSFPGRIFEVLDYLKVGQKMNDLLHSGKANFVVRNYPLTAVQLKERFKLKDGGDKYILGFTGMERKYVVLANRIK